MTDLVQLARPYTEFPEDEPAVLVEPKIDGWRMLARVDRRGNVTYVSRAGKRFNGTRLAHVTDEIQRRGITDVVLDGELLVDGAWGEVAQVRTSGAALDGAVFWVFDLPGVGTQTERSAALKRLVGRPSAHVRVTPQHVARTDAQVRKLAAQFRKAGFEGAVVKLPDAPYVRGRAASWLKVKAFDTLDAVVTGMTEGSGRHKGTLGALEAVTQDGYAFRVGTGMSDEERDAWWARPRRIVGKVVEVKFQPGKVARVRFGTLVRVRTDRAAWRVKRA